MILDANQLQAVPVEPVPGNLTDHYDPRHKRLRLAADNFVGNSVAAMAVAAHECGHALQDADGDRKSTRLNSSHMVQSRMPSSA